MSTVLTIVGIEIVGGDQPLIVGVTNTITCITSLDISDIVWIDGMDSIVASNSDGVQQLNLVFNPVTDSIHNRVYMCRITAVAVDPATNLPLEISETVTITVTGM